MTDATVHYGMSASQYHADADGPRLSQSLATILCNQSPLHCWQKHPLLGGPKPFVYTPSDDDGTIIHALVLEPDNAALIHEIDPRTIKTKDGKPSAKPMATEEGKAIAAAALERGQIPLLTEKLDVYRYKSKAIRSRLEDAGLTFDGDSEVVIYWTEETPHGPVRCRCRIDHLFLGEDALVIDLKTTGDAHPRELQRTIWYKGYDIQHEAYRRAVEAAFPDYVGRVRIPFAFGELDKPYAVNPIRLDAEFAQLGAVRWERGRDLWAKCLLEGGTEFKHWPGYSGGEIGPPAFALAQEMGAP